jgi:nucleoside-diphosphate-sugar epimerase
MKKVLITGASGFIGSFLVEEALKRNYSVYAAIRKTSSTKYLSSKKINIVHFDFSNKNSIKKTLENSGYFHYIIHAAGIIKTCDKHEFEKVNYKFTVNFIEALTETENIPEKFIFVSSLAAYGPGNEKNLKPVEDTGNPHPVTLYGKSKLKAENFIRSLNNFPYIILRPTGVYGPREKDYYLAFKTIKNRLEPYLATKKQHLTFLHVLDFARLSFDALESGIKNKSYFVTDLNYYTAMEFNAIIKKLLNKKTITVVFPKWFVKPFLFLNEKISCLFGKPTTLNSDKYNELIAKNWLCNSNGIVDDFAFSPEFNLENGVKQTIQWFKNRGLL